MLFKTSRFAFAQFPYFSLRASKSNLDGAQEPEHAPNFSLRVLDTKRGKAVIIIILIAVVVLILIAGYFYFNFNKKSEQTGNSNAKILANPVEGLTTEEAIEEFDESFVYYLLASIGAQELHAPPLSSNNPKIEIIVSGDEYNAEVDNGKIKVGRGLIGGEDIIIKTTKEEGVAMLRDKNYVSTSFKDGKSSVELIAGNIELAAKGYLKIYNSLNS